MSSRDSSDVTLDNAGQHGSGRSGERGVQSPFVKGFLKFRKGKPLTQTFLLQESVILTDPSQVACQSRPPDMRGTEGR